MDGWTKQRADAPLGAFVAEAAGLDWIRVAGGPPVPRVHDVTATSLTVDRVPVAAASAGVADDFGQRLAVLHATGADAYGAPWTGFIGPVDDLLPLDNAGSPSWADHFRDRRVVPALTVARRRGSIEDRDVAEVERVLARLEELVPDEGPARLHGDLWRGNVLWSADAVWLVDPAAHGGHRETDLAMLALFGLPHLDRVLAAYDATVPLADGWRHRVPVHQLWPLLVHAALFGPAYGARAGAAARSVL
ncbi:MAG: fructosamine kinase [Frankiales bacterium]|nr:fructosamine kinase [Frankiales bacterium]MCW2586853.1 fructosamine kinase [Frankiales bacterium]